MPENVLSAELVNIADTYGNIALWISVASGALMLIALCFYTLDKKKHAEIVAALEAESVNAESIENEKGKKKLMEADSVADILRESRAENEASSDLHQPSDADDGTDLKF